MDQSVAKAIVERHIEGLMRALGVPHWKIVVRYGPVAADTPGANASGRCYRLLDYENATIDIDPTDMEDEEELLKVLRHELFHVVLSPFDLLRSWMMTGLDGADYERAARVANHATECGVKNLERMWSGMTERQETRAEAAGRLAKNAEAAPSGRPTRRAKR